MSGLVARLATMGDAAAIARIHNEGIAERIATVETEPRTTAGVEAAIADKGDRYPTVVVERGGEVVAWAGAGPEDRRQTVWRNMKHEDSGAFLTSIR